VDVKAERNLRLTEILLSAGARRAIAGLTALVVALPSVDFAVAAPKDAGASAGTELAEFLPLPRARPKPARPRSIGDIIAATGDSEDSGAEDSDAPQASAPPDADVAPSPVISMVPPPPPGAGSGATKSPFGNAGLRWALKLLDDKDPSQATIAAYALPNKVDIKLVNWMVATSGLPGVTSQRILQVMQSLPDWPGQQLMRIRYEQALAREAPGPQAIAHALGGAKPASATGVIQLARAYVALGQTGDAAAIMRPYWRDNTLTDDVESSIYKEFGSLLTRADHKARMDRLLYDEQNSAALRAAAHAGNDQKLLATAVVTVNKNAKADKALAAVPAALRKDPLYLYSRIRIARRADHMKEAAALMLSAPRDPKVLVDPDAWWIERRLISRALIDDGDYRTAYRIAAGLSAETSALRAEAEFHAGWYALEFLHDPATATRHFAAIQAISTMPLSQSRAEYWLGRAALRAGNKADATAQFRRAGAYPTTFYGQLALARLGVRTLKLSAPPQADAALQQRFNSRDLVQVIQHLTALGRGDQAKIFYRSLSETLDNPSEIALLAALAEKNGEHQIALQIGKTAYTRGLPVETLAFPTAAIPRATKTVVEKPVVYAVARQESAFNPAAVSHAGARGLLQLMPSTAKHTAGALGMPFSQDRLTSDPAYNAILGAAHLSELFDGFNGSYVMTFASYNAGRSRVLDWVKKHGDPRDPDVDVVDWIELIPFTETRNYVQRIMENLQVYRTRLGITDALNIDADLKRGKPN
jgi:soluble lytic murein transglycosylase